MGFTPKSPSWSKVRRSTNSTKKTCVMPVPANARASHSAPFIDPRPSPRASIVVRSIRFPPAQSVSPPSTMTVCPVIIAAPAHKKKIVSAMSSGVQARLSGVRSIEARFLSSGQSLFHGLST